jgi:hypothetical protein
MNMMFVDHCFVKTMLFVSAKSTPLTINGKEASVIAAYVVSDGIDRCRVGFLPRHLLKHWERYDGVLAQIVDERRTTEPDDNDSPTKRSRTATQGES